MKNRVDEMMSLLDEMPKVKASSGFYQRTKFLLDNIAEETQESLFTRVLRHALPPALITASIILGIFIGTGEQTSSYQSSGIDAVVSAYSLEVSEAQQLVIDTE